MLGEIRGPEVARVAIDAMLSGHMVLSTIHAGGVFEMLMRLQHLGIAGYDLAESLRVLLNISLVPKLCQCKVIDLSSSNRIGARLYQPSGCGICDYSGYDGRLPAVDLLYVDESVRKALRSLSAEAIRAASAFTNSVYKHQQIERWLLAGEVALRDCQGLVKEGR